MSNTDEATRGARGMVRRILLKAYRFGVRRIALFRFSPSERPLKVPPPWRRRDYDVPDELRTVPGIWRRPDEERAAFERVPLHDYFMVHWEAAAWFLDQGWHYVVPAMPRIQRAIHKARAVSREPVGRRGELAPDELRRRVRELAQEAGLSTIGIARYDPKYTFAEYAGKHETGNVIVSIVEQDYDATQTIPSNRAEKAAFHAYAEVVRRSARLAEGLRELGYRADAHDHVGQAVVIHYGVEAGLGQLGLNGQLLTPTAGSRCRISLITTNLDLEPDAPVDYGMHAICDSCQACVRRCPTGAIPSARKDSRGVMKAKIKTERCLPVVAQIEGCGVCMKVCPIQRYGLDRVLDHYTETGAVLGVGSDELEGFHWPPDDRRYGPGEKPRIDSKSLLKPEGMILDLTRVGPPAGAKKIV
ncbi:MAG: hypothetical protein JWQ18_1133 [Conexibacter sp.]|nr:hypothetical protein [Conexibacter sp.]